MAAAPGELERDAGRAAAARVRVSVERRAQLDEGLGHLVAPVVRRLVERRVAPMRPVGRSEVGAPRDERARLGRVVGIARDVVELGVEGGRGGGVAMRWRRARGARFVRSATPHARGSERVATTCSQPRWIIHAFPRGAASEIAASGCKTAAALDNPVLGSSDRAWFGAPSPALPHVSQNSF